jgi:hypothetical protein
MGLLHRLEEYIKIIKNFRIFVIKNLSFLVINISLGQNMRYNIKILWPSKFQNSPANQIFWFNKNNMKKVKHYPNIQELKSHIEDIKQKIKTNEYNMNNY